MKLETGARVYYHGDMANECGFGTVADRREDHPWPVQLSVTMDDGREITVTEHVFSDTFKGHCGTKWVTFEAWQKHREAMMAKMTW